MWPRRAIPRQSTLRDMIYPPLQFQWNTAHTEFLDKLLGSAKSAVDCISWDGGKASADVLAAVTESNVHLRTSPRNYSTLIETYGIPDYPSRRRRRGRHRRRIFGISNGPWLTNIQQALRTLDAKHTIPFRQSRCAFPSPAFTLRNPISYALDIFKNRHSSRREFAILFLLHSATDCDLRVDAKNDIFTWTFVKKKRQHEGKKERIVKSNPANEQKYIVYCGCNLDTLPLTKKKSARPRIIPRIIVDLWSDHILHRTLGTH